jgi:hypothetical protein
MMLYDASVIHDGVWRGIEKNGEGTFIMVTGEVS